jgi:hypothetical protein
LELPLIAQKKLAVCCHEIPGPASNSFDTSRRRWTRSQISFTSELALSRTGLELGPIPARGLHRGKAHGRAARRRRRLLPKTRITFDVTIEPSVSSTGPIWSFVVVNPRSCTHEAEKEVARRSDYNSHVPATPPDRQVEAAQFVETLRFRRRDRRNWRRGRGNQLVRIWHELDGNSRAQNSDAPRNRAPRRSRTNHRLDSDSDRFLAPDSHWCLKVWFDDAPLAPTRHTRQARKASPQPYVSPESASPYSDADFAWHGCYGRARTRVNEFNGLWLLKKLIRGKSAEKRSP